MYLTKECELGQQGGTQFVTLDLFSHYNESLVQISDINVTQFFIHKANYKVS